jgi:hypothetical protein
MQLCPRGIEVVHIRDVNHSVVHSMTSAARIVAGRHAEEDVTAVAAWLSSLPAPLNATPVPHGPDPETGIGKWSADEFYAMMHTGRSPDGDHLEQKPPALLSSELASPVECISQGDGYLQLVSKLQGSR